MSSLCEKKNPDLFKVLNPIVVGEWTKFVFRIREVIISKLIQRQGCSKVFVRILNRSGELRNST